MVDVSPRQSGSALLAHGLLLGGSGAAIFLAGGAPQGNLGVFLLCAGAALVSCPPRVRVEWPLWAAAAGLAACAGLAFLPARWVPTPVWRRALAAAPAVALPGTITAAPGETAFWLGLLALTLVVGLFALSQPVRTRGMIGLTLAAVTGCAGYAALAMYAKVSGWHYPLSGGSTFGFLPNRNHTATLLLTGSLLAIGLMSVAFRDRRWVVADAAVAGGLTCVAALGGFSESRAGVLILLIGVAGWLAGLRGRHRPGRLLVVVGVAAAAAGGLFFSFKNPVRDRLLAMARGDAERSAAAASTPGLPAVAAGGNGVVAPDAGRAPADPPSEFRLVIYRDTLDLIRDQPWTGSGLGTFAGVFPQYRRASLTNTTALHPESDWLLLTAEAGLPAFACAAALAALAARRLGGLGEHPYWPLRWACAVAAGAALLHGAVDVPAHRAALGWWVLALAGLALQRPASIGGGGVVRTGARNFNAEGAESAEARREEGGRGRESRGWGSVQRAVFVLGGVGALGLGGCLVRAEWFGGEALPPFAVQTAPQRMFDAYQRKDYAAGLALARRTRRDAPLTAAAYYYEGIFVAAASDEEGVDQQTDEWFAAERVVDPVMPDVPQHQALAWAGYDPARQTAMWLEVVGRMGRINRALGHGLKDDLTYYVEALQDTAALPDVQRYLLAVTRPDPRFEAKWAQQADPALGRSLADRLAADGDWLGKGKIARPDWYVQPESAGPVRPDQASAPPWPDWWRAGWPVRLRQMVYAGQYEQAVQAAEERYGLSLALPGGADAGAGEGERGPAAAFCAAWRAGNQDGARRGLAAANVDAGEPASSEVWRWRAALAAHDGRWKEAWLALERYVRHTRQTEWP